MKYISTVIVGFLTLAVLCYSAYVHFPRPTIEPYQVTHMVPEQSTRIERRPVVVDGKTVMAEVTIVETTAHGVWETKTRSIPPTPLQTLQFWCLAGIASIYGVYMAAMVVLLIRDKVVAKPSTAETRDTKKRMDGVSTFCVGVLVGFIGTHDFGPSVQKLQYDELPYVSDATTEEVVPPGSSSSDISTRPDESGTQQSEEQIQRNDASDSEKGSK